VLQWARARSGIDDETWVTRFPRYDEWLGGETAPTLKQLESFARKTHTPVGFLFLDEPPAEPVPIPDFRTVSDRPVGANDVVSADLLDAIYACERRQEWYRNNQILEGEPPLPFVGVGSTNDDVDDVADQMGEVFDWTAQSRASCRGSGGALTWLREHAEAAGVLVMISGIVGSNTHRTLDPHEFRGFALADPSAALVFVNGADSKAAQVFTLVHGLAHLWLGETALFDLAPVAIRRNAIEGWCSAVATAFLRFTPAPDDHPARWNGRQPPACGTRFVQALRGSVLAGRTSYPQAHRLLAVRTASALDRLFLAAAEE
jgi:hypothetical protein